MLFPDAGLLTRYRTFICV